VTHTSRGRLPLSDPWSCPNGVGSPSARETFGRGEPSPRPRTGERVVYLIHPKDVASWVRPTALWF